jgi:PAS domain S-box-containing protein
MSMRISSRISRWMDVPSLDPDDARRRKLLNILLSGVAVVLVLLLLTVTAVNLAGIQLDLERLPVLYTALAGMLAFTVVLFAINRYGPGWLASSLFLLLATASFSLFEEPDELVDGRSLVMFSFPIVMASVILPPYASFIMAALSSAVILVISRNAEAIANPFAMGTFFLLSLVSWLAANGLEHALKDLRTLNVELEQRVRDRTRDLAESLSKTEAILDSTADGIIVLSNNGEATVANPAVAGLLAHDVEQIVGSNFEALMRDVVSDEDRETIGNLLHGEKMQEPSVKFKWGKKTLSASAAPVHMESGEEIGTVAVFRDFTREAEIDRMKSTFVSIASHELRTPLNAIMGYSEMLNEGVYGPLTEQQMGAMGRLLTNSSHMLGLVNNLLDRARIEAGTIKLNIGDFAPAKLIDGVKGVMDMMTHNKGLRLTTDVADDVPDTITGDWQRLHQILINFTNNAIKFTQEGSVDMSVYMHDEDHWALAVSDTGIGIPEDAQQYIFEPFRQVDDSATREYGGAGLGLSIVKQLVAMMGGWIELESTEGKGSTFTVILPLIPPKADEITLGQADTAAKVVHQAEVERV